jgi:hypothetical protein
MFSWHGKLASNTSVAEPARAAGPARSVTGYSVFQEPADTADQRDKSNVFLYSETARADHLFAVLKSPYRRHYTA